MLNKLTAHKWWGMQCMLRFVRCWRVSFFLLLILLFLFTAIAKCVRVFYWLLYYFTLFELRAWQTNIKPNDWNYADDHTIYTIKLHKMSWHLRHWMHLLWPQSVCHINGRNPNEYIHTYTHKKWARYQRNSIQTQTFLII